MELAVRLKQYIFDTRRIHRQKDLHIILRFFQFKNMLLNSSRGNSITCVKCASIHRLSSQTSGNTLTRHNFRTIVMMPSPQCGTPLVALPGQTICCSAAVFSLVKLSMGERDASKAAKGDTQLGSQAISRTALEMRVAPGAGQDDFTVHVRQTAILTSHTASSLQFSLNQWVIRRQPIFSAA